MPLGCVEWRHASKHQACRVATHLQALPAPFPRDSGRAAANRSASAPSLGIVPLLRLAALWVRQHRRGRFYQLFMACAALAIAARTRRRRSQRGPIGRAHSDSIFKPGRHDRLILHQQFVLRPAHQVGRAELASRQGGWTSESLPGPARPIKTDSGNAL
jgi:hypothetical protein